MSRTQHFLDCGCKSCVNQLLVDIEKLEAKNAATKKRIQEMYAGDLSPESRLSGYIVIVKHLQERIANVSNDLNWYQKALEDIVKMKDSTMLRDIIDVVEQALNRPTSTTGA